MPERFESLEETISSIDDLFDDVFACDQLDGLRVQNRARSDRGSQSDGNGGGSAVLKHSSRLERVEHCYHSKRRITYFQFFSLKNTLYFESNNFFGNTLLLSKNSYQ